MVPLVIGEFLLSLPFCDIVTSNFTLESKVALGIIYEYLEELFHRFFMSPLMLCSCTPRHFKLFQSPTGFSNKTATYIFLCIHSIPHNILYSLNQLLAQRDVLNDKSAGRTFSQRFKRKDTGEKIKWNKSCSFHQFFTDRLVRS